MELVVLGHTGIPADGILSIRAGQTRRQAPLSTLDRPFKFPLKPEECATLKVDVLELVGSARAICGAGERSFDLELEAPASVSTHSLLGKAGPLSVSFLVRPAGSGGKDAVAQPTALGSSSPKSMKPMADLSPAKRHLTSIQAEKYLEEHNLLAFMQSILQSLIKEKPSDPYGFVAKQFVAHRPPSAPGPPPILPPSIAPPVVGTANQDVPKEKESPLDQTPLTACAPDSQPAADPLEALRKSAAKTLSEAAASGELLQIVCSKVSADAVEALRKSAAATLVKAAASGELLQVLGSQVAADPMEALRQSAAKTLSEAAASGKLREVLGGQVAADPVEALRKSAAATLLEAAASGELLQVLGSQGAADQMEALKKSLATSLTEASESGELVQVLGKQFPESPCGVQVVDPIEAARSKALQCLMEGAENGELVRILAQREGQTEFKAVAGKVEPGGEPSPDDETDVGRLGALVFDTLIGAAQSGALEKALGASQTEVLFFDDRDTRDQQPRQEDRRDDVLQERLDQMHNEVTSLKELMGDLAQRMVHQGPVAEQTTIGQHGEDQLQKDNDQLKKANVQLQLEYERVMRENMQLKEEVALEDPQSSELTTVLEFDPFAAMEPSDDLNSIRSATAMTLLVAAESGELEELLGEREEAMMAVSAPGNQSENTIEMLRSRAAELLTNAAATGELEKVLGQKSADPAEELRARAATTLANAAANGELQRVLNVGVTDADDLLRSRAAASLAAAAASGELEKVLFEGTADTAEALRLSAARTLKDAAASGELQKVLSQKQPDPMEALRARAASTLADAAATGDLLKVLNKGAAIPTEVLRATAAKTLADAAANGELAEALSNKASNEVPTNEFNISQLKARAGETLMQAAQSGVLENVLLKTASAKVGVGLSKPGTASSDVDVLKQSLSETLLCSLEDGRLEQAIEASRQSEIMAAAAPPLERIVLPFSTYYREHSKDCGRACWARIYERFPSRAVEQSLPSVAKAAEGIVPVMPPEVASLSQTSSAPACSSGQVAPHVAPAKTVTLAPASGDAGRISSQSEIQLTAKEVEKELATLAKDNRQLVGEVLKMQALIEQIRTENDRMKRQLPPSRPPSRP